MAQCSYPKCTREAVMPGPFGSEICEKCSIRYAAEFAKSMSVWQADQADLQAWAEAHEARGLPALRQNPAPYSSATTAYTSP